MRKWCYKALINNSSESPFPPFFLHFKTSSSGDENVSDMTRTAHAYDASVNSLELMLVLMPVLISQV